jgi:hypothetical protein
MHPCLCSTPHASFFPSDVVRQHCIGQSAVLVAQKERRLSPARTCYLVGITLTYPHVAASSTQQQLHCCCRCCCVVHASLPLIQAQHTRRQWPRQHCCCCCWVRWPPSPRPARDPCQAEAQPEADTHPSRAHQKHQQEQQLLRPQCTSTQQLAAWPGHTRPCAGGSGGASNCTGC